jgi:hypothetical protein
LFSVRIEEKNPGDEDGRQKAKKRKYKGRIFSFYFLTTTGLASGLFSTWLSYIQPQFCF